MRERIYDKDHILTRVVLLLGLDPCDDVCISVRLWSTIILTYSAVHTMTTDNHTVRENEIRNVIVDTCII